MNPQKPFCVCRGLLFFVIVTMVLLWVTSGLAQDELPITTSSEQARTLFTKARQRVETMRFEEAEDLLSQALKEDSDFALAHVYTVIVSSSALDAGKHLKKAVALKSRVSKGEQLFIKAIQANAQNQPAQAIDHLKTLKDMYTRDKRVHYYLGQTYFGEEQYENAISEFNTALEIDNTYGLAQNLMGYAYAEMGEYEKSEQAFKAYISMQPDEANPHDSLADLYLKTGKFSQAIEHYEKAVDLNPKFTASQRKIGTTLLFMGNYAQAREAFKKAMEMGETPSEKFTNENMIGQSYIYEGNYQNALQKEDELLEKTSASEFPSRVAYLYDVKCMIYLETGELDKAEQCMVDCRTVIQDSDLIDSIKENWAKYILQEKIMIALHRNAFDTAMELTEQYKTMVNPENNPRDMKRVHRFLGMIHLEQGDYTTAIDHLQQADKDHPFDLYTLAVAESKSGNKTKARDLFSKVAKWNEHSVMYAIVRPKAMAMLK